MIPKRAARPVLGEEAFSGTAGAAAGAWAALQQQMRRAAVCCVCWAHAARTSIAALARHVVSCTTTLITVTHRCAGRPG